MVLFGTTMYHLNTSTDEYTEKIDGVETTVYANKERLPLHETISRVYLLVFGEFTFDRFNNDDGERWTLFILATILL